MGFLANRIGRKAVKAYNCQNYDQAQLILDRAYQKGMDNAKLLYSYGLLLIQLQEFEKAIEIICKGLDLRNLNESDKSNLFALYAIALWKCGSLERSIEILEKQLRLHKNSMIYATLGYLLIEKGGNGYARQICNEALSYDDTDPSFLDNVG